MTADDLKKLEETLWKSADTLRANSDLKSSEYSTPVMGLIFLKFADNRYSNHEKEIIEEYKALKGTRREKAISDIAIESADSIFLITPGTTTCSISLRKRRSTRPSRRPWRQSRNTSRS